MGYTVWYDDFALSIGDSLREKIDFGIAKSKYGIVILSPKFFSKVWPQRELNGLFAVETSLKKILPIWHNVDGDTVRQFSPILADRVAIPSKEGLSRIIDAIAQATQLPKSNPFQPRIATLSAFISSDLRLRITLHAETGYPEMTGGFLLGEHGVDEIRIKEIVPVVNRSEKDRKRYYSVAPTDWAREEDLAFELGLTVIGMYNNVADSPAIMSIYDRDHGLPNFLHLRTSIQLGKAKEMRTWWLDDDRKSFAFVPLYEYKS